MAMESCLEDWVDRLSACKELTAGEAIEAREIINVIKIACYTESQGTSCEI